MGNRWEVWAWMRTDPSTWEYQVHGEWVWKQVWRGEHWWQALHAVLSAKRHSGCVKVEWR